MKQTNRERGPGDKEGVQVGKGPYGTFSLLD